MSPTFLENLCSSAFQGQHKACFLLCQTTTGGKGKEVGKFAYNDFCATGLADYTPQPLLPEDGKLDGLENIVFFQ
jgi:hypothetical protein